MKNITLAIKKRREKLMKRSNEKYFCTQHIEFLYLMQNVCAQKLKAFPVFILPIFVSIF